MSDLAVWNVHGPVETLRTALAMWDSAKQEWQPPKPPTLIRFRPDGQTAEVENRGVDGSISRTTYTYSEAGKVLKTRSESEDGLYRNTYSYDGAGRIVRTVTVDENGNEGGSEVFSYDAGARKTGIRFHPGFQNLPERVKNRMAKALFISGGGPDPTTTTTTYDDHDQPAEILVHNAAHLLLQRMTYARDGAGRLVKEEVYIGTAFREIETRFKDAPPEVRESIAATLATFFGPSRAMSTTTYTYDQNGRQVERINSRGLLGEDRTTFHYDDHDNPIEEATESTHRDVGLDEHGNPRTSVENSYRQHTRYIYKYDVAGNWTEREVSSISGSDKDFQRSNIERRQITYYSTGQR